jgi:hypothetical protein
MESRRNHRVEAESKMSSTCSRPPQLNAVELATLERFGRHRCSLTNRKERLLTLTWKQTSIGVRYDVSCPCGKFRDLTDYDSW